MVNKVYCILAISALICLVGQTAYATNDRDYRTAFKATFDSYKCVHTEGCDDPSSDVADGCNGHVNVTACIDGNVNGWKAYCKAYLNDCLNEILGGLFPDRYHILISSLTSGNWTLTNTTADNLGHMIILSNTRVWLSTDGGSLGQIEGSDGKGHVFFLNRTVN